MGLSTSQLRRAWAPPCRLKDGQVIDLYGEGRVRVDGRVAGAVHALDLVLASHVYLTRRGDTGAFNCRRITGGTGYSLHAYGLAIDINWQTNPYGPRLVTDMPAAMIAEIKALRTHSGKQVWRWGGDYRTNKDAMHFEIVCSPADLATGIANAPTTVAGVLKVGHSGPAVEFLQGMLNILAGSRINVHGRPGGRQIAMDGHYGPQTAEAVREFQRFARAVQQLAGAPRGDWLIVDGIAGPRTLTAVAFWVPIALEP